MGVTLTSGAASTTVAPSPFATEVVEAPAAEAPSTFAPRRFGYLPALDGLRAAAVLAVMAFHAGFPAASGGVLGVSTFFTLSGFLIASLSLRERATAGGISLPAFWERRARRLLPASLVTLTGIVILQWAAEIGSAPTFRGDVFATLAYATNWRLAARGGDYAQMFAAPSPLTHFWSLAIEEQFYLLFPLAFVGLMRLFRRRPLRAGWAFGAVAIVSFILAAWTAGRSGNSGLAYYGTHTRAGELLVGVVLAFVVANRRVQAALASRAGTAAVRYGAVAALAGLGLMWTSLTLGDPRLFRGATLLNALLTGWVILGAVRADGPLNPLLGNWPLRMIGKVSYAAYLIHWPLFLFVDGSRFDLAPRPLFVVRLVLTLTLATISYWVVEYPFRRGLKGLSRPRLAGLMATSIASVAILTLVVPVHPPQDVQFTIGGPPPDFDGDQYQFGVRQEDRVVPAPGNASQADILLVGDSVAWSISPGFAGWNEHHPDQNVTLDTHISFGCPISGPGTWLGPSGEVKTWQDCATWEPDLPRAFARSQPDAIVIVMGLGDLGGREVDGTWRSWGDPAYDEWFRGKLTHLADTLASSGVPVVWLTYPDVRIPDPDDPTADPTSLEINDPARLEALNAMVRDVVRGRDEIHLVDLNGWVRSWPGGEWQRDMRDGVHFTLGGSAEAAGFVVPATLAVIAGDPLPTPPVGPG